MKKIIKLIIVLIILVTYHSSFANAEYCKIDEGDWDAWVACNNKYVKIIGRISDSPMQHPTGIHNTLDAITMQLRTKFENYMDINGSQIVLTSDEEINCKGRIEVEGLVDVVDLGGPDKTKQGYKNIWVKVVSFECK